MSNPSGTQRFAWNDLPTEQVTDMIQRRNFNSKHMTLSRVVLQQGCVVPRHAHPSEQVTYVIEGLLRVRLGEHGAEVIDARAGEVVVIPADVPHEVEVVDTALLLDIFSPPRHDWLAGHDVAFPGQR